PDRPRAARTFFSATVMRGGSPARNCTRQVVQRALPPQACSWSIRASSSRASTRRLPCGTSKSPTPSTVSLGMTCSFPDSCKTLPAAGGLRFQGARAMHAIRGVRNGLQTFRGDWLAAFLAFAEAAVLEAPQGGHGLRQHLLLGLQQADGGLLLEVIGSQVGGVGGHIREIAAPFSPGFAQGRMFSLPLVAAQAAAQIR